MPDATESFSNFLWSRWIQIHVRKYFRLLGPGVFYEEKIRVRKSQDTVHWIVSNEGGEGGWGGEHAVTCLYLVIIQTGDVIIRIGDLEAGLLTHKQGDRPLVLQPPHFRSRRCHVFFYICFYSKGAASFRILDPSWDPWDSRAILSLLWLAMQSSACLP